MVISHTHPEYVRRWRGCFLENGAYYYSKEICEKIIPNIRTDRNWVTINIDGVACDHSVVFIHNNNDPNMYRHLLKRRDLILVCGVPSTCEKVKRYGETIYLPLSVDVEYVRTFAREKTKGTAYVGRKGKRKEMEFPKGTDFIENLKREELLARMAEYEKVYAVGRTAIEAKILGCEILPFDPRYPDTSLWQIVDTMEAVELLQRELDMRDER